MIIDKINKTIILCANTLIYNVTNNLEESYMSELCKMSGGTRIFLSRSGGMNRCAHIVSYQTSVQGWIKKAQSVIAESSPRTLLHTFVASHQNKIISF